MYPPANVCVTLGNHHVIDGKIHYEWSITHGFVKLAEGHFFTFSKAVVC